MGGLNSAALLQHHQSQDLFAFFSFCMEDEALVLLTQLENTCHVVLN